MSNGFSIVWAWSICTSHTSIRFSRPRALCDARRKDFVFLFWWRISEVWDFCVCLHDSRSKTAMRKNRSTTVCHTTASHPHTIGSILQTDKYFSSVNRTYEIDRQICLLCVVWLLIHRLPEPTFLHSLSLYNQNWNCVIHWPSQSTNNEDVRDYIITLQICCVVRQLTYGMLVDTIDFCFCVFSIVFLFRMRDPSAHSILSLISVITHNTSSQCLY